MSDETEKKRQVKVYLFPAMQARLKALAAERGASMSDVVADLVAKAAWPSTHRSYR
jgi:hypothetical protein